MWVVGCCGFVFTLYLFIILGLFPVFSCVLGLKSLIINTIHFSSLWAFAVRFLFGTRFLDFKIYRMWVIGYCGFVFIFCLFLISALFLVFSCVLGLKSLIINAIHFSGLWAFSGWGFVWNTISRF